MITSSANRDSFHALNPNCNLNANPTYIYVGDGETPEPFVETGEKPLIL